MKHTFIGIYFLILSANIFSQKLYQIPRSVSSNDYLPKTIILKVKSQYSNFCLDNTIQNAAIQTIFSSIGVTTIYKKFPETKAPSQKFNELGQAYADLSLIYELNYSADLNLEKVINQLLRTDIFVYAEPHFVPKIIYNPNDPLANSTSQSHLQIINAFNAWNINKGDSSIVIGITDTGTDFLHNDLFDAYKRNYADVIDGLDNDGDGYTDNYMGWDLGMNDNDPTWESNAHGVHVAGIASASADNFIGGAGVGFNCKFLPIKIGNSNGSLVAAYEGIKYAADHGCFIINCSWGGSGASQFGQDIIDYASINKNCLVVAAAGNNGADGVFYPAAYNYVLAVANTSNNDTKASSSNYGYFIDVCAPGENIQSTWIGNTYAPLTGTSMSAPVVAGAAAIVKNQFPTYTALQIAERLKTTTDDVYAINPSYINKLGTGRINLFKALTDPPSASIVYSNESISDNNDESFIVNDTLFIIGKFTNYLNPTTSLNVTVTPLSSFVSSIDNTTTLGVINTLSSKTNTLDPFQFKLLNGIPINESIDFEVLMQDGSYTAKYYFSISVNVDYINITINNVFTTATSKGKIGYNQDAQTQGLGFQYKETDLLYEGGFMIGIDSTKVSDCVRGLNPSFSDTDFGTINRIVKQIPSVTSDFDTKAKINDGNALNTLNVEVEQKTLAWNDNLSKHFVIWEYAIKNTHPTDTLNNLFAGIFADWDIDGSTFYQNRSNYDAATKMGYCYATPSGGKYGGVKLLTNNAPANFYAMDNVTGGNGGIDISNGFDTNEKYKTLSTQRLSAGVSGNGSDNIDVLSTGPIQLLPNQSITVAFALIGEDSLSNLISAANQAQVKYEEPLTTSIKITNNNSVFISPNPTQENITISQQNMIYTTYEIYTINGEFLFKNNITSNHQIVDLNSCSTGVYFVKLIGINTQSIRKIVVIN